MAYFANISDRSNFWPRLLIEQVKIKTDQRPWLPIQSKTVQKNPVTETAWSFSQSRKFTDDHPAGMGFPNNFKNIMERRCMGS